MKKYIDKYAILIIILFSFIVRFWGIADVKYLITDERAHVPAAKNYCQTGHSAPDNFWHPPLKYIILYGSIKIFGDNPYGWRMRYVIFGTLAVMILFFLGKELFPDIRIAYLAAVFLSLDPLHLLSSRASFDEIPAAFFFLMGIYAVIRYIKGSDNFLVIAGLCLGLSISIKWYSVPALFILMLFSLIYKTKEKGWSSASAADIFAVFIILPLSIYILCFFAWFGRGYNLLEFVQRQFDAYRDMQAMTLRDFEYWDPRDKGLPLEWFIKPIIFGGSLKNMPGTWMRYHIFMNNFPLLIFTLPSLLYTAYHIIKHRDRYISLFFILFAAVYLPLLIVKRPVFIYSSTMLLPFVFLFISFSAVSFHDKLGKNAWYVKLLLAILILWSFYLYPLIAGMPVPDFLYAPLLAMGNIR